MKADYLRFIFECLHGDNGIFFKDPRPPKAEGYNDYMDKRRGDEIVDVYIQVNLKEHELTCELCDVDYH